MQEIEKLQKRLSNAKATIIIVAVLTIVNSVLIAVNADLSFTFSAYIPQIVTALFLEIAAEEGISSMVYIGLAIAVFMSLIYVLLWAGARKKNVFITVALVLFSIDTAFLLIDFILYFDVSFIIDVVFHAWVIIDLAMGISAYRKLKNFPVQEGINRETFSGEFNQDSAYFNSNTQADDYNPYYSHDASANHMQSSSAYDSSIQADSTPIRLSENKGRAIISVDYNGMKVEVRRSRGLTELIVDGYVYAEKKGIIETEYELHARVSGVEFSAAMTVNAVMFLFADGRQIAKKVRII